MSGDMFSDHHDAEETPADMDTRSFIPLLLQQDPEDPAIRSAINEQDPLAWPDNINILTLTATATVF